MVELCANDLPVLVFAPFGKDAVLVEKVLRQSGIATQVLPSIKDLQESISEDVGAAIVSEEVLQNGTIAA